MRSAHWYGGKDRDGFIHRAWMRRGLPKDAFDGRPHIAIANTASDLTPCNSHLNEVMEYVKNGIWEAGGVPLNMPAVSLGETLVRPTAMLWRNMAAMATEELIRANPIDGVVLLGGCDKTIPSLLMAASSVDIPALVVPGGPMLTGTFQGTPLGCGTDVFRLSEEVRAKKLSEAKFLDSESAMIRSRGHCNTMGTASTMGIMAEALGMVIPGIAGTPAPDSRLLQYSQESGRRIVEMVHEGLKPSDIMVKGSFLNAIVALAGIGGSTNAVVHLLAIAGRLGINLTLDDFDRTGSRVPLLVNLQPAGKYLMEDFHRAARRARVHPLRQRTGVHRQGTPTLARRAENQDPLHYTGEPVGERLRRIVHSRFRYECLNREQLWTLTEARVVIEDFRQDYNGERPHSSLGYLSPQRFATKQSLPIPSSRPDRQAGPSLR